MDLLDKDLKIQGPLQIVRQHVAGSLMCKGMQGKSFVVIDAYRLIEIYLDKDDEYETQRPAVDTDLLVLLLGFGEPRNRYLPELVLQALSRRSLLMRPTWVVCNMTPEQIGAKYGPELTTMILGFKQVST
jgi:hypothetical protein